MAGKAQRYGVNNWRRGKPSDEKLAADIAHSIREHPGRTVEFYGASEEVNAMVKAILKENEMKPEIIETRNEQGQPTGEYRLVGVPGEYVELPGKGGRITKKAAKVAIAVYKNGGNQAQAQEAALTV